MLKLSDCVLNVWPPPATWLELMPLYRSLSAPTLHSEQNGPLEVWGCLESLRDISILSLRLYGIRALCISFFLCMEVKLTRKTEGFGCLWAVCLYPKRAGVRIILWTSEGIGLRTDQSCVVVGLVTQITVLTPHNTLTSPCKALPNDFN